MLTQSLAVDRVHRIGQEKTVFVKHFIVGKLDILDEPRLMMLQVQNTIEGRILQIQKRKTAIIKEAFKGQGSVDSETMENLKIMFEY